MSKSDLRRFGVQLQLQGRELKLDTSELAQALDRLEAVATEFAAAWEALPVGAREHFDGTTIVLMAHPEPQD